MMKTKRKKLVHTLNWIVFTFIFLCPNVFSGDTKIEKYAFGDGMAENFVLTLHSNTTYHLNFESDLLQFEYSGKYCRLDDRIVISKPIEKNSNETAIHAGKDHPTDFYFVQWGEREYLISDRKMLDFCNEVNTHFEPRDTIQGSVYLKVGDENKPVDGKPDIPEYWEKYLINDVHGKVIKKVNEKYGMLNIGESVGLYVGLDLFLYCEKEGIIGNLKIISVDNDRSLFELIYTQDGWDIGCKVTNVFPEFENSLSLSQ